MKRLYIIVLGVFMAGFCRMEALTLKELGEGQLKNLACANLNTQILVYDFDEQAYRIEPGMTLTIDEDLITNWTPPPGEQFYLLQLSRPYLINYFAMSLEDARGSISLYVGEQKVPPGDAGWQSMVTDMSVWDFNGKAQDIPFEHYGRYILIHLKLERSGPVHSLFVFGDYKLEDFTLHKRKTPPVASKSNSVLSGLVTLFNLATPWANGVVTFLKTPLGDPDLLAAIDNNPGTSVILEPNGNNPSLALDLNEPRVLQRVFLLAETPAAGEVIIEFTNYAYNEPSPGEMEAQQSVAGLRREGTQTSDDYAVELASNQAPGSALRIPVKVGANHLELDFSPARGQHVNLIWKPDAKSMATDAKPLLKLSALGVFSGNVTHEHYSISYKPDVIAAGLGPNGGGDDEDGDEESEEGEDLAEERSVQDAAIISN